MDYPSPSASFSGSFDGAAFAKLLLDSSPEGCTPPRITRFSFEDDLGDDDLSASFSGQFTSIYGLPYDISPPPEEHCHDAASEHSSRGPHTPPATEDLSLLPVTSPPSILNKSTDDPFTRRSDTLFLDPRSLLPEHSLLADTPSFLGLQTALNSPAHAHPESSMSPPRLSRPILQPMPTPTPIPLHMPALQTILREPRPLPGPKCIMASNRGMTVQQLALDLPLPRSRSSSLTALILALEDASPGWYQSLMDSALPRGAGSQSTLTASPECSLSKSSRTLLSPSGPYNYNGKLQTIPSLEGLPSEMLSDLEELEILASEVRRLPIPRPQTMALDVVETAFFAPLSLRPPPALSLENNNALSTPSSLEESRQRQSTVVHVATATGAKDYPLCRDVSAQVSPPDATGSLSSDSDSDQPAIANFAYHPKLTKTLGLRSLPSESRLLAPAPRTPSWRKRNSSRIPIVTDSSSSRAPPATTTQNPSTQSSTKALEVLPKTPKSAKFQSFFRRRPSMPIQESNLGSSPIRPMAIRARLSEPPPHRLARGSPPSKNIKHFSSTTEPPPFLQHQPLGSFLPM